MDPQTREMCSRRCVSSGRVVASRTGNALMGALIAKMSTAFSVLSRPASSVRRSPERKWPECSPVKAVELAPGILRSVSGLELPGYDSRFARLHNFVRQ